MWTVPDNPHDHHPPVDHREHRSPHCVHHRRFNLHASSLHCLFSLRRGVARWHRQLCTHPQLRAPHHHCSYTKLPRGQHLQCMRPRYQYVIRATILNKCNNVAHVCFFCIPTCFVFTMKLKTSAEVGHLIIFFFFYRHL